jgi:8-oxo-dGTP diphosphatase
VLQHRLRRETALFRETREEIGLHLRRAAVRIVTSVHYRNPEGHASIGFFFHALSWDGEPCNAERTRTPNWRASRTPLVAWRHARCR